MKKLVIMSLFALAITCSCNEAERKTTEATDKATENPVEAEKETQHWTYEGETNPEHWAEIEKESACGGNHQSPVDIVTADVVSKPSGLKKSDIHYEPTTVIHDVDNNGHSLQYNFDDKENYVDFDGKRYNLAQFHFHAASEHAVNGMHYPLVIHMVHVSEDNNYVVFAIMVTEGEESDAFAFIESYLPVQIGETKAIGESHHFEKYFLSDFDHYHYKGSLTTPPCTEAVNWFVFKHAIEVSPEQVKAIADLMPRNNYRPAQPLNGRTIYLSE